MCSSDLNEDTTSSSTTIATILTSSGWADVDTGALNGLAITSKSGSGTWQYSTDGVTWASFGTVSATSALLVSSSTQVRYVPDGRNGETATFSYVAWDRTTGTASTNSTANYGNPGAGGGSSAYSSQSGQASLTVTSVNDAPTVVSGTNVTLTPTDENTVSSAILVSSLVSSAGWADVDTGALQGVAVTGKIGNGTWQYSTNGTSWTGFGAVSNSQALLLGANYQIRYVPDGLNGETVSFTFVAWDQTAGSVSLQGAPSYANPAAGGGTTAYSSQSASVALTVASLNDAPWLDSSKSPALTSEVEDAGVPSGAVGSLVSSLVDFATPAGQLDNVVDVDNGAALGIAVRAADTTNGTWYYSINDGSTWTLMNAVSDTNALLLSSDSVARLYFRPNANYNGTMSNAISFRAWDQSAGTNGSYVDTSNPTISNSLSVNSDTASLVIAAVNDAPVITAPMSDATSKSVPLVFSAANGNAISITDVDAGSNPFQVTLTGTNAAITLGSLSGLTFSVGDGTSDATMTFQGTLANINAALDGLVFTPPSSFTGSAFLQIDSNDLGHSGAGGAMNDTSVVIVSVAESTFWLSTTGNASSSAASGALNWSDGVVVNFSNPNLTLGSGTTSGTFSSVFDLDLFNSDGDTDIVGLHYVTHDVIVEIGRAHV